jgi:hypothetical protein
MADASSAEPAGPASFRDIAIVGGGCYGSFYAAQLERARARGKASFRRLLVVDRDPACRAVTEPGLGAAELVVQEWGAFFDRWLGGEAGTGDAIVPSPLMPHLMYEWLVRRAQARWPGRTVQPSAVEQEAGTPYDLLAPDGTRYASFADWLCPTHCIEPALCPLIRAPRTWEMSDALAGMARRMAPAMAPRAVQVPEPVVFRCRHRVYGVGMFDADEVLAGDAAVAEAGSAGGEVALLVGTVSSCHGAISMLHLGAA